MPTDAETNGNLHFVNLVDGLAELLLDVADKDGRVGDTESRSGSHGGGCAAGEAGVSLMGEKSW